MDLHGVKDGLTEKKELDIKVIELIKRIFRLKSIDRARGTNPAKGVSLDLSDEGISKPEQRRSASDGESARRGVPADEMKQPIFVNEDVEYCKHLMKFFKGKK
jgi:hypothetical protein